MCSKNKWTTGNINVAGNSNLVAGNIKKGVNIFGITGTYARPMYQGYFVFSAQYSSNGVVERGPGYSVNDSSPIFTIVVENGNPGMVSVGWGNTWKLEPYYTVKVRTQDKMYLPANVKLEFDMLYNGISSWTDNQRKNSIGNGYHRLNYTSGNVSSSDSTTSNPKNHFTVWLGTASSQYNSINTSLGGLRVIPIWCNYYPVKQSDPVTDPPPEYQVLIGNDRWGRNWRSKGYVDRVSIDPAFTNPAGEYYIYIHFISNAANTDAVITNIAYSI